MSIESKRVKVEALNRRWNTAFLTGLASPAVMALSAVAGVSNLDLARCLVAVSLLDGTAAAVDFIKVRRKSIEAENELAVELDQEFHEKFDPVIERVRMMIEKKDQLRSIFPTIDHYTDTHPD